MAVANTSGGQAPEGMVNHPTYGLISQAALDSILAQEKEERQKQYNLRTFGSETLTPEYTKAGERIGWTSSLAGETFATQAEAIGAEEHIKKYGLESYQTEKALKATPVFQAPDPNAPLPGAAPDPANVAGFNSAERVAPVFTQPKKPEPIALVDEIEKLKAISSPQPQVPTASSLIRGGTSSRMAAPSMPVVDQRGQAVFVTDPNGTAAGGAPATGPGGGAPLPPGAQQFDRARVDALLDPLNQYQNDIYALSRDNTGESEAAAQLNKAHELAKIRARDELLASQAGAMGAARSARNRGDRALLERQAVGEQAYLGTVAQRQQSAADTQQGLDLAILRAKETDSDRRFKLEALQAAGNLGLNTSALEVDIGKANLESAREMVNQEFQLLLQANALTEQQFEALLVHDDRKMEAMLGYSQAMAALQYEYTKLSVEDQNFMDQQLMQKYQIDQTTMVALKQIAASGKFKYDEFFGKIVSGAIVGGSTIAGAVIAGPPGAVAGAAVGGAATS